MICNSLLIGALYSGSRENNAVEFTIPFNAAIISSPDIADTILSVAICSLSVAFCKAVKFFCSCRSVR